MELKHTYKISDLLVKFLIETSNGFISGSIMEKLFSDIETEAETYYFSNLSEANFIRIISAVFNPKSFLRELIQYPHRLEITIAIAASSNYLTDITVRNPEYLYLLFDQYYLSKTVSKKELRKEIVDINFKFNSFNSKANMLRNLKSKSILKIGVRDILGFSSLEETVQQISIVAKAILSSLFDNTYKSVLLKHQIKNTQRKYCLVSLGKLGGRELNYSSDVDLILFFDKNTKIGRHRNIEYFELMSETIRLFIKTAAELTPNGFLYRIDFRLRPEGKNAPLCKTINDYERYYEMRGEDWERQMLIKLDFLCGSKTLFQSFQSYIVHYVYPVSFTSSPIEQIRKMKTNIEKKITQKSNVKLFRGGIRDIEFSIQALQLLNGGKNEDLRTGNTLKAIELLNQHNLLSSDESKQFKAAYIFYRKIEHFLQLLNDTQTHNIPDNSDIKAMLSNYLALQSISEFVNKLEMHRVNVRNIYENIVGTNKENTTSDMFKFEIFDDKQRAKNNLLYLSKGTDITGRNKFDKKTSALFQNLILKLFELLKKSQNPDRTLEKFTKFIRSVKWQSIWYRELSDTKFFEKLLIICEYSDFAVELTAANKGVAEFILSRKIFAKNIEQDFNSLSINGLMLILSVQYTLGLIDSEELSSYLFKYIKLKIKKIAESLGLQTGFFVAALGSLGAKSIGFKSDIDLIFVVNNLDNYELIQSKFQILLDQIKKKISPFDVDCRLRPEGSASPLVWNLESYKKYIAARARVWEFQSLLKSVFICGSPNLFEDFSKAIIKEVRKLSLEKVRNEMNLMIKSLRSKHNSVFLGTIDIKNGYGSLTYIDFVVAFMLIKYSGAVAGLRNKSFFNQIQYFCNYGKHKKLFKQLLRNYVFLKNTEFALQNCLNKRNSVLPKSEEQLKLIACFLNSISTNWFSDFEFNENRFLSTVKKVDAKAKIGKIIPELNIVDGRHLIIKISEITKSNYQIFNIILNGTD